MKSGHDLAGLTKFVQRAEWTDAFDAVLDEHVGSVLETFDLDYEDLAELLGEGLALPLWGCIFGDLLTRRVGPDGRSIVDDYLKRRGWKESARTRTYIKALQASVMSLYEVGDVIPSESFLAHDLVRGGEPVLVQERNETRTLKPGETIATRIVPVGATLVMGVGMLLFEEEEAAAALLGALTAATGGDDASKSGGPPAFDTDRLRMAAPLFTTTWLLHAIGQVVGQVVGGIGSALNVDGEEPALHQFSYPLAKGVRSNDVVARLDSIESLSPDGAKFWNWVGAPTAALSPGDEPAAAGGLDLTMPDGRIVLGNVELKGRLLVLTTASASRAARGTALLAEALGERLLEPKIRIERLDDPEEGMGGDADSPEEIGTGFVHRFLDGQFRRALDEPAAALGGLSPRAAAQSTDGRSKVADWITDLESRAAAIADPDEPTAAYDFGWIWRELGLEDLRR